MSNYNTLSRYDVAARKLASEITGKPIVTLSIGDIDRLAQAEFVKMSADQKSADYRSLAWLEVL